MATFPAQQRPPGDPALIERGKTLYSSVCSACHGVDARGGQLGGPNLLRSQLVLNDQAGELIMPIVKGARAERGMPPIPMPDEDIKAVAEYLHSLQAAGRPQGAPPVSEAPLPERARRRRRGRREIFRRQVQHLSLADGRSARHRDARARRPDACRPAGSPGPPAAAAVAGGAAASPSPRRSRCRPGKRSKDAWCRSITSS